MPSNGTPVPTAAFKWRLGASLLGAAAIAVYAAAFTFAVVNDRKFPDMALSIYPGLVPAASQAADIQLFTAAQKVMKNGNVSGSTSAVPPSLITGIGIELAPHTRAAIESIAKRSLSSSPLATDALRQLAYLAQNAQEREQLLRLSQEVSRRNTFAALQLAEIELRKNRAQSGIAGLNRALVVSERLDSAILPVLLGASQQPGYFETIANLLATDPLWAERLLDWSVANPQSLPLLAPLLRSLPADSPARAKGYGQVIVDLLVQQGRYAEAFTVYRTYAGRRPNPSDPIGAGFPPLDWKLIDNYDSGGRLYENNAFEFFANPGRRGEVAQLLTNLPAGRHALEMNIDETVGRGAELTVETVCLKAGGSETQMTSASAPLADGMLRFPVLVTQACPFQRLRLIISSGNEASSALVRSVNLVRTSS